MSSPFTFLKYVKIGEIVKIGDFKKNWYFSDSLDVYNSNINLCR